MLFCSDLDDSVMKIFPCLCSSACLDIDDFTLFVLLCSVQMLMIASLRFYLVFLCSDVDDTVMKILPCLCSSVCSDVDSVKKILHCAPLSVQILMIALWKSYLVCARLSVQMLIVSRKSYIVYTPLSVQILMILSWKCYLVCAPL